MLLLFNMPETDTSEKAFQNEIINHLISSGYHKRGVLNYNKASCLDVEIVLKFIQETQLKDWNKYKKVYGEKAESKFFIRLVKAIEDKGTINVLRYGFKDVGCNFQLFYPKPNNKKNPDLFEKYEKNIFSIIDELEYQDREKGNRLDLVLFINGLPIITIELKDTFSQGVDRAINQYKKTRDQEERIFKNCFVHFAMSDEAIWMTTKLAGDETRFLPFNKGIENEPIENDFKTSYLYKDILQINKLSKLISNFIYLERNDETGDSTSIFPRFHQLECVNNLLEEVKPGKNYLIQHSAGSGKTKTIAWLAHGLMNKFGNDDERVYDMIIVVSDRKVIDSQLYAQVQAFEKVRGIVDTRGKDNRYTSKDLKESLTNGSNIFVTTLQKFPFVIENIGKLPKRKYAIILDEAHSSQTGTTARKMRQVLSVKNLEEAEVLVEQEELDDVEEELLKDIESSKNLKNVSFFAFTATPKNKTLEMFGVREENDQFRPYHLYSMKQAIEEGFILDVLKYYLDYATYFNLVKKIEEDPEYEEKKAKRLLRNFVEKHPHTVSKKVEIMLDHFMSSTIHKIGGKARAMVVARSRLHAVLYKKAFDRLISEEGYPIKTLVAFTGVVKDENDQSYSEDSMNELAPKETIEDAFGKEPYKILIVANKYQTGFDQPLLHTMYIDKQLNGITAVQTLSRANRIAKNKSDTLIVDFANLPAVIKKSFEPYYEDTYLEEPTDPYKLYDLQEKLSEFHIFDKNDIDSFVKSFKSKQSQAKLHNILHPVVEEFKKKTKKQQVNFKKTLRRYQSIYSFLSQLIPFADINLEKLYIFNKFLIKKLPAINNPLPYTVMEDVDMDSYKIKDKGLITISLSGNGGLEPISDKAGMYNEEANKKLSMIVKELNESYGTKFSEDDKVFLGRVKDNLLKNKELTERIENNSKQNVRVIFDRFVDEEIAKLLSSDMNLYKRIVDNDKLRKRLESALFELVYQEFNKKKKPEESKDISFCLF
jgi:type I restriction enzyme, R subunit